MVFKKWVGVAFCAMSLACSAQVPLAGGFVASFPSKLEWKEMENGVKTAVLFGNPSQPGLYIVRNIFPAGVMSTPHAHDQDRWVTVIKGTWNAGMDADWDPGKTLAMPEGSMMYHPANAVHFDGSLTEPVEVQIMGVGPVKTVYVNSALGKYGKPHPLK